MDSFLCYKAKVIIPYYSYYIYPSCFNVKVTQARLSSAVQVFFFIIGFESLWKTVLILDLKANSDLSLQGFLNAMSAFININPRLALMWIPPTDIYSNLTTMTLF